MNNLENGNNYDVYEMTKSIAEDENLKRFFEKYRIAKISEINFKKYFNNDDSRCIAIVDVQEDFFNHSTKILIDLRIGQPSVNQVYDALYDIGQDCDIKIIIYTNGYNEYDEGIPVADEYVVAGLIGKLQSNNVPIVLFSIDQDTLIGKYVDMYQNWYAVNRLIPCIIPSKEDLMWSTFWGVYFDSFSECFYEPWNAYNGLLNGCNNGNYIIYIDEFFHGEIRLLWDDEGAGYEIKQISESDQYLKNILDVKMPVLKEKYGEDAVPFENVVGRLPRLYVNYSDKPFNWLYTAKPKQITEFANEMYHDAWNLRWLMEGAAEELYQVDCS
jgi:hypothetical protein